MRCSMPCTSADECCVRCSMPCTSVDECSVRCSMPCTSVDECGVRCSMPCTSVDECSVCCVLLTVHVCRRVLCVLFYTVSKRILCLRDAPKDITERPHAPSGVAVFMSAHSKTPYITPSMKLSSGKGVVRGRRGQHWNLPWPPLCPPPVSLIIFAGFFTCQGDFREGKCPY